MSWSPRNGPRMRTAWPYPDLTCADSARSEARPARGYARPRRGGRSRAGDRARPDRSIAGARAVTARARSRCAAIADEVLPSPRRWSVLSRGRGRASHPSIPERENGCRTGVLASEDRSARSTREIGTTAISAGHRADPLTKSAACGRRGRAGPAAPEHRAARCVRSNDDDRRLRRKRGIHGACDPDEEDPGSAGARSGLRYRNLGRIAQLTDQISARLDELTDYRRRVGELERRLAQTAPGPS